MSKASPMKLWLLPSLNWGIKGRQSLIYYRKLFTSENKIINLITASYLLLKRCWVYTEVKSSLHLLPLSTLLQPKWMQMELQHGRRVRCGDHLPPHKYIRNTSTCGTAPTEHLLNAGRRPQTSQKARNSPRTWVG